jgi:hypothetical protein
MRNLLTNTAKSIKSLLPNLGKLALVAAISTSVLVGVGQKPAEASAVSFVCDVVGGCQNVWYWVNNGWVRNVYVTSISPQETQSVRNNYGAAADSELNARCTSRISDYYGDNGWDRNALWFYRWVLVAARSDGGSSTNCYLRRPLA